MTAFTALVTGSTVMIAVNIASTAQASPSLPHQPLAAGPGAAATQSRGDQAISKASAQAAATDEPVVVDALTTPTAQMTAQPDGTLSVEQALEPVRVRQGGVWKDLDPTLHFNSDGTVSPNVTVGDVKLSGGGVGPFATFDSGGRGFTMGWLPLPKPTLSGAAATYSEVITGVDMTLTVQDDGSVEELIIIKNRTGATNPWLTVLKFGLGLSSGTSMIKNGDGTLDITADADAEPVYSANAPLMWDTVGAPDAASAPPGDNDEPDADPVNTDPDPAPAAAGAAAKAAAATDPADHVKAMKTAVVKGDTTAQQQAAAPKRTGTLLKAASDTDGGEQTLEITPDQAFLNAASTVYPVYLDPTPTPVHPPRGGNADEDGTWAQWTTSGPAAHGYAYRPTKKHSDTGRVEHNIQVGFMGWYPYNTTQPVSRGSAGTYVSRGYVQLPIDKALHQAGKIVSSKLNIAPWHAPGWSCSAETVGTDLYLSDAFSKSNKPNWTPKGGELGHVNKPACSDKKLGYDITSHMQSWLGGHKTDTKINFQLKAHNESNAMTWKQIKPKDVRMTTVFNRTPNAPQWLASAPGGACQASPAKVVIGNDDMTFSARHSDPDSGTLATTFHVTDTATGKEVWKTTVQSKSGTTALTTTVKRSTIQSTWFSDGAAHTFTWYAQTSDGELTSPKSSTCGFTYDPRAPHAPGVKLPTTDGSPIGTVGAQVDLQFAPCQDILADPPASACAYSSTEAHTAGYVYQLNSGPPVTVTAPSGDVAKSVPITLTRVGTNTLTVKAMSAGGNYSELAVDSSRSGQLFTFSVKAPASAVRDADINGDNVPDLLLNGTTTSAGLWLASGVPGGHVSSPVNIGATGPGYNTVPSVNDWNGAQPLHGDFTNDNVQDVAVYYPQGDPIRPGYATVLYGTNSADPLSSTSDMKLDLKPEHLRDRNFRNVYPTQLIAAGNATGDAPSRLPDLIGILGEDGKGRELVAFSSNNTFADYNKARVIASPGDSSSGTYSGDKTPDNPNNDCPTCTWSRFTIVASQKEGVTTLFAMRDDGALWSSTAAANSPPGTQGTWTSISVPWTSKSLKSGMDRPGGPLCLDALDGAHINGTAVRAWDCNGLIPAQQWTLNSNGNVNLAGDTGLCLEVVGGASAKANGTKVDLSACVAGAVNQQWQVYNGGLKNPNSGRCLDAPGSAAGAQLDIWDCNGGANQRWTFGPGLPKLVQADVRADGTTELWWRNLIFATSLWMAADGKSIALGPYNDLASPLHNWSLHDGPGTTQASDQGGTPGVLNNVSWTDPSTDPVHLSVAQFEGDKSWIKLGPDGVLQNRAEMTLSFQFQAKPGTSGILLSTGHDTPDKNNAAAMPLAYIGTDGRLYAQFWNGVVRPMTSPRQVNDGQWHTVTLETDGANQSLFIDNHPRIAMALNPTVSVSDPQVYVGGGVFPVKAWVNSPGGNTTAHPSYFTGTMANVLMYNTWLFPGNQLDPLNKQADVTGRFVSGAGPCMDNRDGAEADGNKVAISACSAAANANQDWTVKPDHTIHWKSKCLNASGTANKSLVVISTCSSSSATQQWYLNSAGEIWNAGAKLCLTNPGNTTANGVQLQVATCAIGPDQTWRYP
ncbi:ricin-type beta-trefoil lectin domain protein [Actinomadura parmotrematis]|uniref:Ricin-type beta-trefoil lectin domain protein n=1 Tax=Actinomadura parmotrematis TaxID=2864039 RepID=A0ABS7FXU8_9ACTN|nr:ricin-type beta-trefoil lectin domain protein [Actinomadura parmotrematis]MBW8484422.1 ricin-type beta-trefoil lectin domain protein [Actinomadura parmotrematis]